MTQTELNEIEARASAARECFCDSPIIDQVIDDDIPALIAEVRRLQQKIEDQSYISMANESGRCANESD